MTALHCELSGPPDAPTLLLAGSLGTDLRMWDGQLPLAARLRPVRFDHRGHGGSPAPPGPYTIEALGRDVLELMDALSLERASFAGLSLGGMVGMWLAAHAPERIDRLVVLCSAAWMPSAPTYAQRAAALRTAGVTEVIADGVLERWLTAPFAANHRELRSRLHAMIVATSPQIPRATPPAARRSRNWTCAATCPGSPRRRWSSPARPLGIRLVGLLDRRSRSGCSKQGGDRRDVPGSVGSAATRRTK